MNQYDDNFGYKWIVVLLLVVLGSYIWYCHKKPEFECGPATFQYDWSKIHVDEPDIRFEDL